MFGFRKSLPKKVIKQIEQNADRIQKWFDNESHLSQTDCEMRGVKIPKYVLMWGDRILRASRMPRDYRKYASKTCLIFWNSGPEDLLTCIENITIPECCIHCGVTEGLHPDASRTNTINTIPDSAHYLALSDYVPLSLYHCEACKKKWRLIKVRFAPPPGLPMKSETRFLTFEFWGIDSIEAYRVLAEKNSQHIVPFFEALSWKQVSKEKLLEAFQ